MSNFFNFNNPVCMAGNSPSTFSYDPSILSLKELLLYELKQIAYYVDRLEGLDIDKSNIRGKLIDYISLIIVNLDFKRNSFNSIIESLKKIKEELEEEYQNVCENRGVIFQPLKPGKGVDSSKADLITAINQGERQSLLKNTSLSKEKKNLYEIMMNLITNACFYLVEIKTFDQRFEKGEKAVVRLLNATNFMAVPDKKLLDKIEEFGNENQDIISYYENMLFEKYGPITQVDVSLDMVEGKAILVSGHSFKDLELVLEATKERGINVYTHGELILAHAFDKLKKYPHLVGHYQKSMHNFVLDYSSFPGAILMTRNSQPHIDLIRGRLFTLDKNPAYGMTGLSDENMEPLIKSALEARGFTRDEKIETLKVGFDQDAVNNKLAEITNKLKTKEINHLILIDLLNYLEPMDKYMEKLFSILPKDDYIISFSYKETRNNLWHINSFSALFLFNKIIKHLKSEFNFADINLTVFLTRCDIHSVYHVLNLKHLGIKHIFLGECCPTTVNPTLVCGLQDLFNIHKISNTPEDDLKIILNGKS